MTKWQPDLKWLGFQISDPIQNPDHLEPNLFWAIQNPDKVRFQIPTVYIPVVVEPAWGILATFFKALPIV